MHIIHERGGAATKRKARRDGPPWAAVASPGHPTACWRAAPTPSNGGGRRDADAEEGVTPRMKLMYTGIIK